VALVALGPQAVGAASKEVVNLPGFGPPRTRTLAGYMTSNASDGSELWYLFYAAEHPTPAKDGRCTTPLLIWLNGGPGASSSLGNFLENGPYRLQPNTSMTYNPHGWNQEAHIMFVDQPVGTGFSYSRSRNYVSSYGQLAVQVRQAILDWYVQFPEYSSCPLHMTGESYAGVYLPAIGFELDRYNRHGGEPHVPFTSLIIGNPGNLHWAQYGSQLEFFRSHGLASDQTLSRAEEQWKRCAALMEAGNPIEAFTTCEAMSTTLQSNADNVFLYDVRIFGDFYDDVLAKNMNDYLTREDVIDAFGAQSPWQNGDGTASPNPGDNALRAVLMTTEPMVWLGHLLDRGYEVTIYDGVMDASSCNHLGVFSAAKAIRWSGQESFINARRVPWGGVPFGFTQAAGGFRFVWVMNSGHLVPYDQPEGALEMLRGHLTGRF